MKNILSLVLTVSIFLSSLGQSAIYFHYLLKKQYYASVLCENKAKPKMQCEGKCQLKKELKEQEEKNQGPVSSSKVKQETLQIHELTNLSFAQTIVKENSYHVIYLMGKPQSQSFSIFHPPTV